MKQLFGKVMECYLSCLNKSHHDVLLPNNVPVVVGRMAELGISDTVCSRSQLELTCNSHQKYVLVKRLGANPSQIDGITIERNTTSKLIPGQKLFIVNMKYPHCVQFRSTGDCVSDEKQLTSKTTKDTASNDSHSIQTAKRSKGRKKIDVPAKRFKTKTDSMLNDSVSEYSFKSNEDDQKISLSNDTQVTHKQSANNKSVSKHWSMGLKSAMLDESSQVFQDDQVIVIKDKYPKAKYHWLVLPKDNIATTSQLEVEQLSLVQHMLKVGKNISKKHAMGSSSNAPKFRYGYHAIASMSQLHMHVISQDFVSTYLKTKKHWNSFTTKYFVDATDIIEELKTNGKVKNRKSHKSLLDSALRCHICGSTQKNMPSLKRHIELCQC